MYSIFGHGRFIADRVRMDAYAQALRHAVKPGSVVLDIGTGTGVYALLACQFGARRVYAIELADIIQVAREIAAANGYSERIEFIQDLSTRVTLAEQVDVVVSEIHGVLPLFRQSLLSIYDARQRLLAPGGVLIPQYETLWVAVVEAPDLYSRHVTPWDNRVYGLDMAVARGIVTNLWRKSRVKPEQLLVAAEAWATLDYATLESPDVSGEVAWKVGRAGTAHGLIVWFDTTLAEGVSFSNGPDAPELIFGNAFFPWLEPVTLAVGDRVSVSLQAKLVGEDYVWRWDTCVLNQGYPGEVKANFKQSTFFGALLSPAGLRKRSAAYFATLNDDGQADHFILGLMDGQTSAGKIARQVMDRFPASFSKWEDALARVADLSQKYCK